MNTFGGIAGTPSFPGALARPHPQHRRGPLALGTAQRNIAAALVVASQSFTDPKVVVMVIVVAIVGLVTICRSRGCWERARNPASCDRDRRRTGGCAPNYDARADPTGLQTNSREGP